MFTALIAGLCAMVINHPGPPLVGIGTIKGQSCELIIILPDGGTTPPMTDKRLAPHRFGARIGDYAAIVNVDELEFRVPRGTAL